MTRAGFVALAGRPNVGKSTLINAIVGAKIAIVSDRPQTTRRAIRGVATGPDWQLVLVDLPGVQRPRDALTERMARRVNLELAGADAALMIVNGEEGMGARRPLHRRCARGLARTRHRRRQQDGSPPPRAPGPGTPRRGALAPPSAEVFPISARTGLGITALVDHLAAQLPESPFLYEAAQHSDMDPTSSSPS